MSLVITEQPQLYMRFRYKGEGSFHGVVLGRKSTKEFKTFPTVKILNHSGYAQVEVRLVKSENDRSDHPHRLMGRNEVNIFLEPSNGSVEFKDLQILRTTKNDYEKNATSKTNGDKAGHSMNSINYSKVHFMFVANLFDLHKKLLKTCYVVSDAVTDNGDPLKMKYKSLTSGCMLGGEDLVVICSKIRKDDVKVLFIELGKKDEEIWNAEAEFFPTDVYHQHAIVCKTPPYKSRTTLASVTVYVQLYKPSDKSRSSMSEFTYTPMPGLELSGECVASRKRRIIESYSPSGCSFPAQKQPLPFRPLVNCPTYHLDYNSAVKQSEKQRGLKSAYEACSHTQDRAFQSPLDSGLKEDFKAISSQSTVHQEVKDLDFRTQFADSGTKQHPLSNECPAPLDESHAFMASLDPKPFNTESPEFLSSDVIEEFLNDDQGTQPFMSDQDLALLDDVEIDGHVAAELSQLTISDEAECDAAGSLTPQVKESSKAKETCTKYQGMPTDLLTAQINEKRRIFFQFLSKQSNENLKKILHRTVEENKAVRLYNLLSWINTLPKGYDVINSVSATGRTALHVAAMMGNCETTQLLLKAGADPLIVDPHGNHAIHVACRYGNNFLLTLLVGSKHFFIERADLKNNKGLSCFHLALQADSDIGQCLALLHEHGFDPNVIESSRGRTPLHFAAAGNQPEAVRFLVSKCRADVSARSYDGYTPLHLAESLNLLCVVALLLDLGASRDVQTPEPNNARSTSSDDEQPDSMRKEVPEPSMLSDCRCFARQMDDRESLSRLTPKIRMILSKLLSADTHSSNWKNLSEDLKLSSFDFCYQRTGDPVNALLRSYDTLFNGTISGFIKSLNNIGRSDVAAVLEFALDST